MKMNWFFAFILGCFVCYLFFQLLAYVYDKGKSATRDEKIEKIKIEHLEKRLERLENILIENQK